MVPVEFMRHNSLLIGLKAINSLKTIFGGKIPRLSRAVVGPPVSNESDKNSEETEEQVYNLVAVQTV